MRTASLKKALLAGTAFFVLASVSTQALATTQTLTGDTTWAADGTHDASFTDASDASSGDDVNLATHNLLVTDDHTANDGSGFEFFNLGTVDNNVNGAGGISILQDAAGSSTLNVGIFSITNSGGGASTLSVDNNDGADQDVSVSVTYAATLGGALTVTNNETDAGKTVNVTFNRHLDVTGPTTITAGSAAGAAAIVTNKSYGTYTGAVTLNAGAGLGADAEIIITAKNTTAFSGGLTLNDGAAGLAKLIVNGPTTAPTSITGDIVGAAAGEGTIIADNDFYAVSFGGNIGGAGVGTSLKEIQLQGSAGTSFSGTVRATTINIENVSGADTFSGAVTATNININAANTAGITFSSGAAGNINYTANGLVTLADNKTITGAVDSNANSTGKFTFAGDGSVTSTFGTTHTLNTLTLSGSGKTVNITGNLNAADTTVIGDNTLHTGAAFSLGATQSLAATITGATTNGKVTATGNATVLNGAELIISVDGAYTPTPGYSHVYTFVDGAGGTGIGQNITITNAAPSLFYTMTQVADTTDLRVLVHRNSLAELSSSGNNGAVGTAMETIGNSGDALLTSINSDIAAATTAEEVDNTLGKLLPANLNGAANQGAIEARNSAQQIAETMLASLRAPDGDASLAAGHNPRGIGAWIQGYARTAYQGTHGGIKGYDSNTWGAAIGFDTPKLVNNGIVGVMFNFGTTDADSRDLNTTSTTVDSYGLTLYGSRDFSKDTFVNAQIGYAYNDIVSDRHNAGGAGLTSHGSTHSDLYSAKVVVGRDYKAPGSLVVTPTALATYSHIDTAGYTETGTGANLTVGNDSKNVLNIGVGVNAGWNLKNADGSRFNPLVHAGYGYDVIGDKTELAASFTGDPASTVFTASGPSATRGTFNAGAGVTYYATASWDASANYDYQLKQDYHAHKGVMRITTHF